ncbi:hypothetical protein F0562_031990 [Nyssa sinensis]|uniref:K Homology domain-containing protein n=1 Tax=Nyssa sinensis TaxID=561372 RepID=A0A5J5AUA9_9ASTE|nr:hypothetical protein F0562_031990 [Nyssa sinensis]
MESPDSRYASSPDVPPRRSSPPKSPTRDNTEKNTHIRFLASNAEAGSVIGKGGSTITDFQSQSGARIQLSRNQEFFPGTSDRIIMVSGTVDEILKAMELILAKLLNEFYIEDGDDADPRTKVSLIAPNSSCGGIIGKGGATIKLEGVANKEFRSCYTRRLNSAEIDVVKIKNGYLEMLETMVVAVGFLS